MNCNDPWFIHCVSEKPANNRRIRIGRRLKGIGDTVLLPHSSINGTIVDIVNDQVSVIAHSIVLSPTIASYPSQLLRHGTGISAIHRAWLNGLAIYHFDTYLLQLEDTNIRYQL